MDWNAAIEKNREALKRVLAMLVAMAEFAGGRATLPRHLHRAILRLLRPAESAARRLVIVAARGLVVTLPPPRPRKAKQTPTILRNGVGTGIVMPRGALPDSACRFRPARGRSPPYRLAAVRSAVSVLSASAGGPERRSAHLLSRLRRSLSRRAPPPAFVPRPDRRGPPQSPPGSTCLRTRRPAPAARRFARWQARGGRWGGRRRRAESRTLRAGPGPFRAPSGQARLAAAPGTPARRAQAAGA